MFFYELLQTDAERRCWPFLWLTHRNGMLGMWAVTHWNGTQGMWVGDSSEWHAWYAGALTHCNGMFGMRGMRACVTHRNGMLGMSRMLELTRFF